MRCSTSISPFEAQRNQGKRCSCVSLSHLRHLQLREVKTRAQECSAPFLFWLAHDGGDSGLRSSVREVISLGLYIAGCNRASVLQASPAQPGGSRLGLP